MKPPLVILGAGGHAAVILELARALGYEILGLLDANPDRKGSDVLGCKVLGGDEMFPELRCRRPAFAVGVGAVDVRGNAVRRRLFERLRAEGFPLPPLVHPTAHVSPSATLADGAQVLTGAIVHTHARVGTNALVNSRALVEHDCRVGDHAMIGPGAVLCGTVHLGEEAFVGAGAIVLQTLDVGARGTVAAGAAAIGDVPADVMVTGVPAQPHTPKAPVPSDG